MSESRTDLIEIIEGLASEALFKEACEICAGKGWYFGNRSSDEHAMPFWKMDLDGVPAFDAIWQAARPHCEKLAGRKLRVVRQYGNGHTYGLGGQPHLDDDREGTFTLLYYPMPEWKPEWQGETVFHDETGEIDMSVTPRPNRAVFFDARIPHAGRAPSRSCPALRVTVAFKLEPAENDDRPAASPPEPVRIAELERKGAQRVYQIHADAEHVAAQVAGRLQEMAKTLRLPGFRPGKIPLDFLESRYGARTRSELVGQLGLQTAERLFAAGGLPASLQLTNGADSGDVEFRLEVTHLPDLPEAGAEHWKLERLTTSEAALAETGLTAADASELLSQHLHLQALDHLHATYQFPVAAPLVERELEVIQLAANALPENEEDKKNLLLELREIAERRVKLGAVVLELARRHRLAAADHDPMIESRVIAWLISQAQVTERPATLDELLDLAG
ncbi:MAG: trigger factor [Luteolibacter sp.]